MKEIRQAKIRELVLAYDIETQEEMTKRLAEAGFDVTQATVSRDIRALKLTKAPSAQNVPVYILPGAQDSRELERLNRVFKDGFVSMDFGGNLLVIRTFNGMAMAVGAAVDAMRFPEILGTVAGDDVVMCAVKTEAQAAALMEKLRI